MIDTDDLEELRISRSEIVEEIDQLEIKSTQLQKDYLATIDRIWKLRSESGKITDKIKIIEKQISVEWKHEQLK